RIGASSVARVIPALAVRSTSAGICAACAAAMVNTAAAATAAPVSPRPCIASTPRVANGVATVPCARARGALGAPAADLLQADAGAGHGRRGAPAGAAAERGAGSPGPGDGVGKVVAVHYDDGDAGATAGVDTGR